MENHHKTHKADLKYDTGKTESSRLRDFTDAVQQ